jgi:hypothetical protein
MITNNIHEKCAFDVAEAIRSAHQNAVSFSWQEARRTGARAFWPLDMCFMSVKYHSHYQS